MDRRGVHINGGVGGGKEPQVRRGKAWHGQQRWRLSRTGLLIQTQISLSLRAHMEASATHVGRDITRDRYLLAPVLFRKSSHMRPASI